MSKKARREQASTSSNSLKEEEGSLFHSLSLSILFYTKPKRNVALDL